MQHAMAPVNHSHTDKHADKQQPVIARFIRLSPAVLGRVLEAAVWR